MRRDKLDEQKRFRRYGTGGRVTGPARTDDVPAVLSEGGPVDSFDGSGSVSIGAVIPDNPPRPCRSCGHTHPRLTALWQRVLHWLGWFP